MTFVLHPNPALDAMTARTKRLADMLVAEIAKRRVTVSNLRIDYTSFQLTLGDNIPLPYQLAIREWGFNRKDSVVFGSRNYASRFVVRDDGSYNAEGLANVMVNRYIAGAEASIREEKAQERLKGNEKLLAGVEASIGEERYGLRLRALKHIEAGKLGVAIDTALTPDQIRALHGLLKSFSTSGEWK